MSKAVLFDMDGVLVDTEPEYREIEAEIYTRLGIVPTAEDLSQADIIFDSIEKLSVDTLEELFKA